MTHLLPALMLSMLLAHPASAADRARPHAPSASARADVRININTADAELLDEALIGIGPGKARAIVNWRRQHGAFRTLDELEQVKGLGPAFMARNRERLRLQ